MLRALLGLAQNGTFNNPTFTGVVNGGTRVLAQSFAAVSCPADITEDTLAMITVPANSMGANGLLRVTTWWRLTNNANAKTGRVHFGGVLGSQYGNYTLTSGNFAICICHIANLNATNSQGGSINNGTPSSAAWGLTGGGEITSAVDTTQATTIVITGQKALAGDTLTLAGYVVELLHP